LRLTIGASLHRRSVASGRPNYQASVTPSLARFGPELVALELDPELEWEFCRIVAGVFTPLLVERKNGAETQLFAKEVRHAGRRYIVCRNEAEAEKDRADRQAIIAGLERQLRNGDKALIGNSAYRRYLRRVAPPDAAQGGKGKPGPAFEIDAGKLAEEARYDGLFVLRTNARVTPLQAMLRYRELLAVETLFRKTKGILRTRPI
jgi:hypothetical protein